MKLNGKKNKARALCATSCLALCAYINSEALAQTRASNSPSGATALPPVVVQSPAVKRAKLSVPRSDNVRSRSAANARPGRQAAASSNRSAASSPASISGSPIDGYVAPSSSAGTKTDTPLMQTPASISVVTHQQIVDQNAQSISQALRYTPGVIAEQRGINEDTLEYLYSRGFQATTFLDGLPIPPVTQTGTSVGFNLTTRDTYFIDRVESIRGPLSVLYGQVPPGGFFDIVSKQPTDTPFHEVFLQTGSYGRAQGGFDFSGPLNDEKTLLYRLTATGLNTGTQTDFVDQQRIAVGPSITWRPNLDTSLTVSAYYQNDPKAGPYNFVPAVGTVLPGPVRIPRSFETGDPAFDVFRKQEASIGYAFEHRFDDVWQIKQNVRYLYNDMYLKHLGDGSHIDPTGTALLRDPYTNSGTLSAFTIDNQAIATFNTGILTHKAVFGVDYQNYQYNHKFFEDYVGNVTVPPLSLINPLYGQSLPLPNFLLGTSSKQNTQQTGLYAQDQIGIGKFTVVGGVRQDWETSHTVSYKTGLPTDEDDHPVTGRIGLMYNFASGVAPYASYATSFQPQLGTDNNGAPLKPTEGEQYEVGVKYQPVGSNSLFTVAAFDLTQTNVVATDNNVVTQTGEVRSRGIELEARTHLTDRLQTIAAYTYDEVENIAGNPTILGKAPIGIPRNTASLWLTYDVPDYVASGLKLSGGVRYVGSTFGDTINSFKVPSFTLVDLGLQYDLGRTYPSFKGLTATLSVSNLFDKDYISSCLGTAYCIYGQGRLALAGLRQQW
ncbi:MAG: iron complex outerrane recepter protein [Bradyrhizobium sp.]|nr:iron complex outerrane recepter protein [Bradyrhizobium sp.]